MRLLLFILLGFSFLACEKEIDNNQEHNIDHGGFDPNERYIEIEINSINDGDTIFGNDELKITGNLTSNFTMHGYSLKIKKDDTELFVSNQHIHGNEFNLDYEWTPDLNASGWIKLNIVGIGNHYGSLDFEKMLNLYVKL